MRTKIALLLVVAAMPSFIPFAYLYFLDTGSVSSWTGYIPKDLQLKPDASDKWPDLLRNRTPVKAEKMDIKKCRHSYDRSASAAKLKIAGYNHTRSPDCNLTLCDLNKGHYPVKVLTCGAPVDKGVTERVTVIVKTSQRLKETMRLITSVHKYYPGLRFEIADDQANIIPQNPKVQQENEESWLDFLSKSNGTVHYTKLQGDAGISKGRNTALRLVKTKYFLLLDDDFVATEKTNISKLVDILDRTDLTTASADLAEGRGRRIWSGIIRIHQRPGTNQSQVLEYPELAYEEIPLFPSCYAVDYTLNLFLGKTEPILKLGGWDENLPVEEHRAFLLTLRQAGYKSAYCSDVVFRHLPPRASFNPHTKALFEKSLKQYYTKKWKVASDGFISCKSEQYVHFKCR